MNELGRGVGPDGKRVVSEANLTRRWKPQVKISADVWYGLGWITARVKGLRQIQHGGGTMGFATLVTFLPEKGIGAVAISNGTGGHLANRMIWARLMELWFGIDKKADATLRFAVDAQRKALAKLRSRLRQPDPALIQPLLGVHRNAEIGKISIRVRGKGKSREYLLDAGEYRTRLMQHDRPDGKKAFTFTDPPLAGLEIEPASASGAKASFEMKRAQERYVFARAR